MTEQGIGRAINLLRKESGYTLSQLAKGVCSISELAKLESGEILLNPFQIDRLFSRLGKAPAKLEYIVSKEMYAIYKIRYYIQKSIAIKSFERARKYLKQYEEMKYAKKSLNRQFIDAQRAQVAWLEGKANHEVIDIIEQAIRRTMPDDNALNNGDAISADELNLLLFRWEVCYEGVQRRSDREIKDILKYAEYHCKDQEELARVYPYGPMSRFSTK